MRASLGLPTPARALGGTQEVRFWSGMHTQTWPWREGVCVAKKSASILYVVEQSYF